MILPSQGTLVAFDQTFTHSEPINVYKTNYGYTTDFDITSKKLTEGTVIWIAPDGSDYGDGSYNAPLKTIDACVNAGANTIKFKRGIYYANTHFNYPTQTIATSLNLIGGDDVVLFMGGITNHKTLPPSGFILTAKCYVENLTFIGGKGLTVRTGNDLCALNGCKFLKSSTNGLTQEGKGIYVYNCEASDNWLDGFNYHDDSNNIEPTGVNEIYCRAYRNGNSANRSSNGSTIHDHGRIIRLKGDYGNCHGGIIAESEAMSYNFDINAYGSTNLTDGDEQYCANFNALTVSTMWLYNCNGYGSKYHLSATTRSTINVDTDIADAYINVDANSTINVLS